MLPAIRHRLVMLMTNLLTGCKDEIIHLHEVTDMPADRVVKKLKQTVRFPSPKQSSAGGLVDPGITLTPEIETEILSLCQQKYNGKMIQILIKIFKGRARFIQVVEFLLGELKITTGYRLFLLMAAKMTSFNLREVVKSPRSRHGLCPLFLRLLWYGKLDSLLSEPPEPKTKDRIIQELDNHDSDTFECVTSDLANLTAYQLLLLMGCFKKIVKTTYTGAFFQSLERSIFMQVRIIKTEQILDPPLGAAPLQTRENDIAKRGRNEAIASIKNFIRLDPSSVSRSLDSFDARLFTSRLASEKKVILSSFISCDFVVNIIVKYHQEEMQSFFSYLSSSPQFKKFSDEVSDSSDSEDDLKIENRDVEMGYEKLDTSSKSSESVTQTDDQTHSIVGVRNDSEITPASQPSVQQHIPFADLNPLRPHDASPSGDTAEPSNENI